MPVLASDLLPFAEAAALKGCTAQTLRNAARDGRLREHWIGKSAFIVRDAAFECFKVEETGGRLHRKNDADTEPAQG